MFHNCEGQTHKTVSTDHNLSRERRAEADSNRGPSAYQPNNLLLGQTGSRVGLLTTECIKWLGHPVTRTLQRFFLLTHDCID